VAVAVAEPWTIAACDGAHSRRGGDAVRLPSYQRAGATSVTVGPFSHLSQREPAARGHRQPAPAVRRRQWRSFDYDEFCDNLRQSVTLTNAPDDCASLVECYNSTLQSLLDQHAPFAVVKPTGHGAHKRAMVRPTVPVCQSSMHATS